MSSFYLVYTSNSNDKWLSTDDSHVLQKSIRTVISDENNKYFEILLDKGYRCVTKCFIWNCMPLSYIGAITCYPL